MSSEPEKISPLDAADIGETGSSHAAPNFHSSTAIVGRLTKVRRRRGSKSVVDLNAFVKTNVDACLEQSPRELDVLANPHLLVEAARQVEGLSANPQTRTDHIRKHAIGITQPVYRG